MKELGEKMERGEVFLSQVLLSGQVMQQGFDKLMERVSPEKQVSIKRGTIILGTVRGDIHDIGKKMVSAMLRAAGFKVIDIGVDVPSMRFIEEAQKNKANIIAMSSLLTVSRPFLKETIKALEDLKLRDKIKVVVGGGAVTEEYVEEIGADGYGKDMMDAVKVVSKLSARETEE
jgi:5-methyltetrahydrofolate--homocysteine methyltransferase